MNASIGQSLCHLGKLRVSNQFKSAVLADVISVQAKQIRAHRKRAAITPCVVLGVRGRRLLSPEPSGFSAGPRHGRRIAQRYYVFCSAMGSGSAGTGGDAEELDSVSLPKGAIGEGPPTLGGRPRRR